MLKSAIKKSFELGRVQKKPEKNEAKLPTKYNPSCACIESLCCTKKLEIKVSVADLTFSLALLGLHCVLQLSFIVGPGHVHTNTKRLHEHIFYFIQFCPDAGLQQHQKAQIEKAYIPL